MSLDWPVLHAPSDAPDGALLDLERLAGLRDRQATALRTGPDGALLGARWREQVRDEGAAVAWAYVAAEKTGAITLLPGMRTTWAATYDPRRRPWYVAAKEAWQRGVRGRTWTAPYVDGLLRRPVVACVAPVVAPAGELLGVAAIDLDAQELARQALGLEGLPGARRVALLDARGRELLATGGFPPGTGAEGGELMTRPFAFPGVVEGVVAGRSGRLGGRGPPTGRRSSSCGPGWRRSSGPSWWSSAARVGAPGRRWRWVGCRTWPPSRRRPRPPRSGPAGPSPRPRSTPRTRRAPPRSSSRARTMHEMMKVWTRPRARTPSSPPSSAPTARRGPSSGRRSRWPRPRS